MAGWRGPEFAPANRFRSGQVPRRAFEQLEDRRLLTSGYLPLNLVSDQSATALVQDGNLVNPWGQALNATGGDLWIADRGTGVASLYFGAVAGSPFQADTLVVSIPGGNATGATPNSTTSFVVQSGSSSGPASFLFDSTGGDLTGWSQGVPPPSPSTQAQNAASTSGAVYTGLALANNGGQNFLYAADFHDNRIDVFNSSFQSVTSSGGFTDAGLPAGFAPYNIVNLGGQLLVSYAKQDGSAQNAVPGAGDGAIDIYDLNGVLQKELVVGQTLNAPWGMALAPSTFGDFAGDLLVANSGDGSIHAFNPQTGALAGTLSLPSGAALSIDGLRGLSFGNGLTAGNSNELFFSAGSSSGQHGLVGAIQSAQGVAMVAQGTAINATANMSFNGTLAVFSDAQNLPASSFTATINWGDGMSTSGGVSALAGGGFAVSGSHVYFTSGVKSISIQIHDSSGKTATASALARVASPGLTASGQTVAATEGTAFSGPVATFTDGDGNPSTTMYTATIAWGDGATTPGTISFSGGKFSVLGSHTYADEGTSAISTTINDFDGTNATVASTAQIADAPLTGFKRTLTTTETATFSAAVATFTDANPNSTAGELTATINWGDGATTAGTVTQGAGGIFTVAGTHSYADEGSPTLTITVKDIGGESATINSVANVADADVLSALSLPILPTEGVQFNGAVALITNLNTTTPASDFTASIDWGDGSTTAGTMIGAAGIFTVQGKHTYSDEGPFVVSVSAIDDGGTASASVQSTITAADNDVLSLGVVTTAPTEGIACSGAVAMVSDTLAASPNSFAATIDWGDGTIDAATLSGTNGHFTISGTHTYARFGTYQQVVSITDDAPGTALATATCNAVVADAPLSGTGATVTLTEGQTFSDTVATITDANANGLLSDFGAQIDWGDGTTTAGLLSQVNDLLVAGTHAYNEGGTYQATVTVDDAGGATATVNTTFVVTDFPLVAAPAAVAGTEGSLFSGPVATFVDTDPDGGDVNDFSVTIDWGDGTVSPGMVAGSAGNYQVSGSHVFSDEVNAVVVVINDKGGTSATITVPATIADADAFTPTGSTLSTTEGQALTATLATFSDSYLNVAAGELAAEIDWGDGVQTAGTVAGSAGSFTVSGSHAYARPGQFIAQAVLSDDAPGTSMATADSTINVADAPLTSQGVTLAAVEGNRFSGTVASFSDGNASSSAADFTATIEWGDGTTSSPGSVTLVSAGNFIVTGTHVYADEGGNLPVTVIITDSGGSQTTALSTANVDDAPLTAGGAPISATEGTSVSGAVAAFTDGNPNATAADFTATIDWGDGTSATSATVNAAVGGGFVVTGSHTYAEEAANLPIKVTINDRGGSAATAVSTANVADAALNASAATFNATEGSAYTGTVATFSDDDPAGATTDFSAKIDWGDGSSTTLGTIAAVAGGGFVVSGSHLYTDEATRSVTVTIQDGGGSSATATSTAEVADAALTAGPLLTITTTQGVLFSGTLGTFTDANPNAAKSDFSASIDWGDGSLPTAGTIQTAPGNVFIVSGSHSYANPAASRTLKIIVSDVGGSQVTLSASAHVASSHFVAAGVTLAAIEGTAFNGMVATCNDSDPNAGDYSASINWGDGTTSTGTVAPAMGGGFQISGTHVFPSAGPARFTVVMTNASLDYLTATSQANVADAPLTAAGATITATEGSAFTGSVATFTDADPGGTPSDYSAAITWGDGSQSAGTIAAAGGGFVVSGSHTYAEETQGLKVSVTISDVGGAQATASSTASVADAPLELTPANPSIPAGGVVKNAVVATLVDEGGPESPANYTATIDWGDGTSASAGSLTQTGNSFQITGSHNYALSGNYTLHVSVRDEGGSTAAVDVQATDPPSANQLYIQAVYEDVLARAADTAGLMHWLGLLNAGQSRSVIVDALDHSAEYFGKIIVTPAYQKYLGRAPESQGLTYWVDQMQNHGLTDERLEAGFIGSPEFYTHTGGTNKAWVDGMYEDLLGRAPDAAGESYWLQQLAAGASRADVAYGFAAGRERESQRITDDYMHYLGRSPDEQGLNFWVDQFAAGMTNEQVITGFVASDEYYKKHTGGT